MNSCPGAFHDCHHAVSNDCAVFHHSWFRFKRLVTTGYPEHILSNCLRGFAHGFCETLRKSEVVAD